MQFYYNGLQAALPYEWFTYHTHNHWNVYGIRGKRRENYSLWGPTTYNTYSKHPSMEVLMKHNCFIFKMLELGYILLTSLKVIYEK
jgi:hypothetical protein